MINLTPRKLITYVKDYDYNIDRSQARIILELLDDVFDIFESEDIIMATDYILLGQESRYANCF